MSNFIQDLITNKTPVRMFLVNGVKLEGVITGLETEPTRAYVLLGRGHAQFVQVRAVATVIPQETDETRF